LAKPPAKTKDKATESQQDESDPFAQEIAKRIGSIVGKEHRGQIIAQMVSLHKEERFSGPIAHPKHLREYEEILPGSADRIVGMAEGSLAHNQKLQEISLSADIEDMRGGRRYGFSALVLLIVAAVVAIFLKEPVLAGLFLGTGALGTIGVLVRGVIGRKD